MKKLILIDSNALVHRAFHALPPLTSPTGQPTNAVYGFLSVLLKMIADLKPDYMVATFDLAGPTFRHKEYEQYKAHRIKAPDELYVQIPVVKQLLGTLGIPVLEHAGFEADDIIGTVSEQTGKLPGLQTVIVTGDLDTLQLIEDKKVVVFTLRKGMTDTVIYDEDMLRERYGIAPEQVPDLKGLKGDQSDNIPGVSGIGEKTATALIQTFGSIENLYTELEKPNFAVGKKSGVSEKLCTKLLEQKEMALFSKKLATIICDVPVPFALDAADWHTYIDRSALEKLCRELGFHSLVKRIDVILGAPAPAVTSPSNAIRIERLDMLPKAGMAAVHAVIDDKVQGTLWLTVDGERVFEYAIQSADALSAALSQYHTIVGHDIKKILKALPDPSALYTHEFFDTCIAAWLSHPDQRVYELDRVYGELMSQTLDANESTWPLVIWKLKPLLHERISSLGMLRILNDLELPLISILATMERTGIQVDTTRVDALLTLASREVAQLEEKIHRLAGGTFNINSPAQLGDILFTKLGIQGKVRRTSGGALSTKASELEKLRHEHPIIDFIMQYREMNKLKTTYIEPFPTLVGADRRIHTTYNQTGTATGRLSSSDPNLQNVPTRTELGQQFRAAFVASKGTRLLSLDYSQLELRLVAHVAHDETMLEAFRSGEDIHVRTASEVFGLAPAQITRDMRRQAKVLNFGIIYGMGVLGFAQAAGVDRATAKKFIDEYFTRFAGVAKYMERTKEEAFQHGFVSTLLGRRRPLPDITSNIPQLAAQAERMAINHPIQGTGADLMKLAMIAVARYLRTQRDPAVRLLLQVHDELVLEVPIERVESVAHELAHIMETVYPLDVPLVVDAKSGEDWAHMQTIEHAS